MKKLSPDVIEQIKTMLPELRTVVQNELKDWKHFEPGENFLSNEMVIKSIPFLAYQQVLNTRNIRLDTNFIIDCINEGFVRDLRSVVLSTLRNLILMDYYNRLKEIQKT